MHLSQTTLQRSALISKYKLLTYLCAASRFREISTSVEQRIEEAINWLPVEHHDAALAIFSSVLYLPNSILVECWRKIAIDLTLLGIDYRSALFLELDFDSIRDDFFRSNNIQGRLSAQFQGRSVRDIVDAMRTESLETGDFRFSKIRSIISDFHHIVLLSDNCLSGTSVLSEVRKINQLLAILGLENPPVVIAALQVATESAVTVLRTEFPALTIVTGLLIPNSCALADETFSIFDDSSLVPSLRRCVEWFGENVVRGSGHRLDELAEKKNKPGYRCFGFGSMGWPIVTYKNCPNNSLPILWLDSARGYRAPFPRLESRTGILPASADVNEWLKKMVSQNRLMS